MKLKSTTRIPLLMRYIIRGGHIGGVNLARHVSLTYWVRSRDKETLIILYYMQWQRLILIIVSCLTSVQIIVF